MSTRGPRKKKAAEEGHDNSERWLLTYSDMITLLMVLFVVLYSISQLDAQKFKMLSDGLARSFGAPVKIMDGGSGIMQHSGSTIDKTELSPDLVPTPAPPINDSTTQAALQAAAQAEVNRLEQAKAEISAALASKNLLSAVKFRIDERGLEVSIVTDKVLFPADLAQLQPAGKRVLDVIAPVLRRLPDQLSVEGNTNTVPVKPKYYPTEWELSAARAVAVLRYLYENDGVPEKRLQAAAFADQRPLYPPSDPRATQLNRRVEIVVLSSAPAAVRSLLPQVAGADGQQ